MIKLIIRIDSYHRKKNEMNLPLF